MSHIVTVRQMGMTLDEEPGPFGIGAIGLGLGLCVGDDLDRRSDVVHHPANRLRGVSGEFLEGDV